MGDTTICGFLVSQGLSQATFSKVSKEQSQDPKNKVLNVSEWDTCFWVLIVSLAWLYFSYLLILQLMNTGVCVCLHCRFKRITGISCRAVGICQWYLRTSSPRIKSVKFTSLFAFLWKNSVARIWKTGKQCYLTCLSAQKITLYVNIVPLPVPLLQ